MKSLGQCVSSLLDQNPQLSNDRSSVLLCPVSFQALNFDRSLDHSGKIFKILWARPQYRISKSEVLGMEPTHLGFLKFQLFWQAPRVVNDCSGSFQREGAGVIHMIQSRELPAPVLAAHMVALLSHGNPAFRQPILAFFQAADRALQCCPHCSHLPSAIHSLEHLPLTPEALFLPDSWSPPLISLSSWQGRIFFCAYFFQRWSSRVPWIPV